MASPSSGTVNCVTVYLNLHIIIVEVFDRKNCDDRPKIVNIFACQKIVPYACVYPNDQISKLLTISLPVF